MTPNARRTLRCGALAAMLAVLAGCATVEQPAFAAVQSRSGLVNWRYGERSLTADVVFQEDAGGRVRLVASKGANLLTATEGAPGIWTVTGPLVRQPWRGTLDEAPLVAASWVNLLAAYRAYSALPRGTGGYMVGNYRARFEPTDGPLRRMEVIVAATGDRFDVRF